MASCSYWLFRRYLGGPLVCWCPWVWRIPNRNAAALLHNNIPNDQLLHRERKIRFTVTPPRVQVHLNLCCSELLHRSPEVFFFSDLHYRSACAHLRGSQVLHQPRHLRLHSYVCCPKYYTKAPKYYSTKAPDYYTTIHAAQPTTPRLQLITPPKGSNTVAPKYDGNQSGEHLHHPTRQPRSFE
jgi:hypothetical protein